ncbi:MAG: methylated-DNA--[protein]-cysteine S-methyltransferase [Magnetococcales bacterium]|nr:methylated-DNA--[protein]-cysteine S-methyltransferase [Magnetococcales bacterium]
MNSASFSLSSPVGDLYLKIANEAVVELSWQALPQSIGGITPVEPLLFQQAKKWLQDYFKKIFYPPPFQLSPSGTPFQQSVWDALLHIPVGKTVTYGEIAQALNTAPRAVGRAVGSNPIPLLIPCHRVVAKKGWGGYSGMGGIETKKQLLALER